MKISKGMLVVALFALLSLLMLWSCDKQSEPAQKQVKAEKADKKSAKRPAKKSNEVQITLTEAEKNELILFARKAFDTYVKDQERLDADELPEGLRDRKVNRVFATIYKEGEWRGCVSSMGKNIGTAVVGAIINTVRDRRFKNPLPEELDKFRVELSFLQPTERIDTKDPVEIEKVLEPGVDGIIVTGASGKRAFFLPYVFVKKQRTTVTWLERLSRKAGMDKDAWKLPDTVIERYGTINFIEEKPYGKSVDLYRYKVELDELPEQVLSKSIDSALKWFEAHKVVHAKRFAPGYDNNHHPLKKSNDGHQLFALSALNRAAELDKNVELGKLVRWGYQGIKDLVVDDPEKGLLFKTEGVSDLEGRLLLGDLLISGGAVKGRKELVNKLAAKLRTLKAADIPEQGRFVQDLRNFTVYVVAGLAQLTKDAQDRKQVLALVDSCWNADGPWALTALAKAAAVLSDPAMLVQLGESVQKTMGHQYRNQTAPYADFVGAFDDQKVPTTVFVAARLRSLAEAYGALKDLKPELAKQIAEAIMLSSRWLFEQQFTKVSAFYFENWAQLQGAFKRDILLNQSTLIDTASALLALLEVRRQMGDEFETLRAAMQDQLRK